MNNLEKRLGVAQRFEVEEFLNDSKWMWFMVTLNDEHKVPPMREVLYHLSWEPTVGEKQAIGQMVTNKMTDLGYVREKLVSCSYNKSGEKVKLVAPVYVKEEK